MKVRITCTGTRPLLMHNVRLASPLDPYVKKLKQLNAKLKKTDDDYAEISRWEFQGGLYYEELIGPYLPAEMLLACLVAGARQIKAGQKVERGVVVVEPILPLIYDGPRDIEGLWGGGDSPFIDRRLVTVPPKKKVDRTRPIFRDWKIEADLLVDTEAINKAEFVEVAKLAGQLCGLGDYRRLYGRFSADLREL